MSCFHVLTMLTVIAYYGSMVHATDMIVNSFAELMYESALLSPKKNIIDTFSHNSEKRYKYNKLSHNNEIRICEL